MSANMIQPVQSDLEIQSEALDVDRARKLDARIRLMSDSVAGGITKLADLIDEAKRGQIHQVLGFASWTAYLADALSKVALAVDIAGRRELVAVMADEGMSQRAIAQAVGVSQKTVDRDLDHVSHSDSPAKPAPVVGLDGKTYSPPEPKPPSPPRRRPITDAFGEGVYKVSKMAASLERLSDDDRFGRNLDALRFRQSDLVRARDALNRVLAKLDEAEAVAG